MSDETEKKSLEQENNKLDETNSEELEFVNRLIDEADPEFKELAEKITEVGSEINPEDIEVEEYTDDISEEESEDINKFQIFIEKLQIKFPKLNPLFKKIDSYIKNWEAMKLRIRNKIYSYVLSLYHYLKNDFPSHLKLTIKNSKDFIINKIRKFFDLFFGTKTRISLSLILLVALSVSSFMFYKLAFNNGWLPQVFKAEITSFSEANKHIMDYNKDNLLYLHEAFPEAEYAFKLKNIVVNLKSAQQASSPAFASIVFYLSLDSTDTAVEIKDREIEILDATQRSVEEYSYGQLNTIEGQKSMLKSVKKTINEVLNQGFVKDVYIKHKILKPES